MATTDRAAPQACFGAGARRSRRRCGRGGISRQRSRQAKSDMSPVTIADREAEAVLVAAIAEAAPGVAIIAEEAVSAGHMTVAGKEFFLVDPLDGTREFIEQRGEFTVNIALVRDGVPVFGIVYAPACEELYITPAVGAAAMARVAPGDGSVAPTRSASRRSGPAPPIPVRWSRLPAVRTAIRRRSLPCALPDRSARNAGSSLKFWCDCARGRRLSAPGPDHGVGHGCGRRGAACRWRQRDHA